MTRLSPAHAASLAVAGLVPLSTVDWPGKLAAVVFLQGCPWDCGYCQNPDLRDCTTAGTVTWEDVLALLRRRRGLLDGVVFSGGEATRQRALIPAIREVRELGFAVGLHTAGAYPARLADLLPLVDWVGLDIKALPGDYPDVVGFGPGGDKAWESLDLTLAAGVPLEVRLTVHPDSPQERHAIEIARRVKDAGATAFALQKARTEGTRPEFVAAATQWDQVAWTERFAHVAAEIEALEWKTFEAR